jgi:nucleotide-binding universal stress UspA family protein
MDLTRPPRLAGLSRLRLPVISRLSARRQHGRDQAVEHGTDGPTVILAAIDGSPASQRALAYAVGLSRREHAELICTFVDRPSVVRTMAYAWAPGLAAMGQTSPGPGGEIGAGIGAECGVWGVRARFIIRRGDLLTELTALADEVHADMIVVGASRTIFHRIFGSLASRLAYRRKWLVMVVP